MATNSKEYNKKNYSKYWGNDSAIKDRTARNAARRKKWLKVWDPREVDHKNWVDGWNWESNLRVISRETNRKLWAEKAIKSRKSRLSKGWKY